MLVVVEHVHLDLEPARERVHERVDRPVALALDDPRFAVHEDLGGDAIGAAFARV
jgi:hypothetical protein